MAVILQDYNMLDSVRGLGRDITKTVSDARKRLDWLDGQKDGVEESCDLLSDNKYKFRPCSQ